MKYFLQISLSAENDLEGIRAWYDKISQVLSRDFMLSARDTMAHIRNYPEAYAFIHAAFRRANIRRFPYGILFYIEENSIKVSGVIHTSRSPEAWQSRMQ